MDPLSLGTIEFFARSIVAGALLWAGAAKIGDAGFVDAAARLTGLPAWILRPAALALPPVELALGVALLLPWTAQVAAAMGLLLLTALAVLLARHRWQRSTDSCACFGSRDQRPISWHHVARNVALAAALVPAVVEVPTRVPLPPQNVALAIGVAALVLLSIGVLDYFKSETGVAKGVSSQ